MGEQSDRVTVAYAKQTAELALPAGATMQQLGAALAERFGVAPHTIKLLAPGAKGAIRLQDHANDTLELAGAPMLECRLGVALRTCSPAHHVDRRALVCLDSGIHSGAKLKMLASRAEAVEAVLASQEDSRVPSFEHELRRELRRAGAAPESSRPPLGQHTFQRYEAWQRPGLSPPPAEALKLLHR